MRKKSVLLGVAAATMLMTAGCQSKYEKIEAPGAIVESAAEEQKAGISENNIKAYGFAFEGKNVLILD